MKKLLTVAATLILVLVPACAAQETCKRHAEPEGGFSYCPPEGWDMAQDSRLKFKSAAGPRSDVHTPNISFIGVNDPLPLKEVPALVAEHYSASAKRLGATYIKTLSQSEFTTSSEQHGFKVVLQSLDKGLLLRITHYHFSMKGDEKLIITATCLDSESKVLEPVFDRAVKTLRIDK